MTRVVHPGLVAGTVAAAASKSALQRLLALAALSQGRTEIGNATECDDVRAVMALVKALGASVKRQGDSLLVTGTSPRLPRRSKRLDCGESGLALRMFAPIAALWPGRSTLSVAGSLCHRPAGLITEALQALGLACGDADGKPPVWLDGPLGGGRAELDGSLSSQLLTGLLLALPLVPGDSSLRVSRLRSTPYIDLTLELQRRFGVTVKNQDYKEFTIPGGQRYRTPGALDAEGDWSGAAFFLVAGAIAGRPGGAVAIGNLNPASCQGDKAILTALRAAGATALAVGRELVIRRAQLRAFAFDATDCPDLFPPLVALAAASGGCSQLRGARRLKHKESDRAQTLAAEFGKLGVPIELDGDLMLVHGRDASAGPPGATRLAGALAVESHGDHRIAMALAVAALSFNQALAIDGSEAVAKSWPGFFADLAGLGVRIDE